MHFSNAIVECTSAYAGPDDEPRKTQNYAYNGDDDVQTTACHSSALRLVGVLQAAGAEVFVDVGDLVAEEMDFA